ncbi:methyltransferase domain-containing protein [Halobacillus sp. A1]|uniref:class I SAM-dependent methyltransferase n=1 Tax=Halobacillus sp. A1 TaxID=2880262 RepID=UPI0020A62AD5|nr:methyltransferase domain-containing protein [Halobacillus sp. A1]MCP3029766.1 methyltransferase domain-containing protein [Halobacillus sp. A1]
MLTHQFEQPKGRIGKLIGRFMAYENNELNNWTQSFLNIENGDTVLEVGFGPGEGLTTLAENYPASDLIGIDPSEAMVDMVVKKLHEKRGDQQFLLIHGKAETISSVRQPIDKVYAVNNVTFWGNPVQRLSEIRQRMVKGGKIALTLCPHEEGATDDTTEVLGGQLTSLLQDAGFQQIEVFIKPTEPNNTVCAVAMN